MMAGKVKFPDNMHRELSPGELRALQAWWDNEGNIGAAADSLGVSFFTIKEQLKFARTRRGKAKTVAVCREGIQEGWINA